MREIDPDDIDPDDIDPDDIDVDNDVDQDDPKPPCPETMVLNEVKLLLAEKRTSLATMRTGIAVVALPLSVLGLLVATSRYYDVSQVLNLLVPLLVMCVALITLGGWLIARAIVKIRRQERLIQRIKRKCSNVAHLIEE